MMKVFVNGFKIDDIEMPDPGSDLREAAFTEKVKEAIGTREIFTVYSTPSTDPKLIMIYTEL